MIYPTRIVITFFVVTTITAMDHSARKSITFSTIPLKAEEQTVEHSCTSETLPLLPIEWTQLALQSMDNHDRRGFFDAMGHITEPETRKLIIERLKDKVHAGFRWKNIDTKMNERKIVGHTHGQDKGSQIIYSKHHA